MYYIILFIYSKLTCNLILKFFKNLVYIITKCLNSTFGIPVFFLFLMKFLSLMVII